MYGSVNPLQKKLCVICVHVKCHGLVSVPDPRTRGGDETSHGSEGHLDMLIAAMFLAEEWKTYCYIALPRSKAKSA